MKVILILAAFALFGCAYGQAVDVKAELLKRVADVEARVNATIALLTSQNRTNLANGLHAEGVRLQNLANELSNATNHPGPEALRLLEAEISLIAGRVAAEERFLEQEARTQDQLLVVALNLHSNITAELTHLRAVAQNATVNARERQLANESIVALEREQGRMDQILGELERAQAPQQIAVFEAELRAIETRIYEHLRQLQRAVP